MSNAIKNEILKLVRLYHKNTFKNCADTFIPGDPISYGGRIFDAQELVNLVDSALEFWLSSGRYADQFEKKFSQFLNIKNVALTNSGSSANLLAFMALTSSKLGERKIEQGDEIITVSAGFPTTMTPLVQFGAIPVFVDITVPTYNIDCGALEEALSNRTKAVMIAHTLGNPFDLQSVMEFCERNRLWLIEDNCDALGSQYNYQGVWKYTGTIGHLGTSSFYPSHQITMGEGGAVYTDDKLLHRLVRSFRDWGRDCWCQAGKDGSCGMRFQQQFGDLPYGYDHKYTFSHFGYNLKITDLQAAIGCAQLEKLLPFIEARQTNWKILRTGLNDLSEWFILPEATPNSKPCWFGFPITIRENSKWSRPDIIRFLESKKIQTRMLFAGNIIRHPCFDEMRRTGHGYRIVGDLKWTNFTMSNTFWIGLYPGINKKMLTYMIDMIRSFVETR